MSSNAVTDQSAAPHSLSFAAYQQGLANSLQVKLAR